MRGENWYWYKDFYFSQFSSINAMNRVKYINFKSYNFYLCTSFRYIIKFIKWLLCIMYCVWYCES